MGRPEVVLESRNITKLYKGEAVIENISITARRREIVGLIGRSGVGKSTFFHILSGLMAPDSGQVFCDGEDITGRPGFVGYMQQKDLLLPYKTILDNVSLPLVLRGEKRSAARQKALELLPKFDLEDTGALYPSQLSGGMRQRAALLRTWLFSAKTMLLDEPFSALDSITRASMQGWYLSLLRELGITAFLITHDLDEAIIMCDRVYVISGVPGRITFELRTDIPDAPDFLTGDEFLRCKRALLENLGIV